MKLSNILAQKFCFCGSWTKKMQTSLGPRWLSGRVLDLRSRVCGFEPQQRHCIVSLSKTHYPLLKTGSTQEDRKSSWHDWKIVDWDVKYQHNFYFFSYLELCYDLFFLRLQLSLHNFISHLMTEPTKCHVEPVKILMHLVWSESLLWAL